VIAAVLPGAGRTVPGMNPMPSPPFPDPNSQMLGLIITNAINAMEPGEVDARGAIIDAAVHGYMGATSKVRTRAPDATSEARCASSKHGMDRSRHELTARRTHEVRRPQPPEQSLPVLVML
jgi:hypothetical protein